MTKRMEVSRRRVLIKHLEPARPLRRCLHDVEPVINTTACAQTLQKQEINVYIEQLYKAVNLCKPNKARISYTRDFLIHLASCPDAKKRPEYLPEHPIVLREARDPGPFELGDGVWNGGKENMVAEKLDSS